MNKRCPWKKAITTIKSPSDFPTSPKDVIETAVDFGSCDFEYCPYFDKEASSDNGLIWCRRPGYY